MSEETFQARALYEFTGQDETELNFQAEEILTITSTNTGEGWWHATNALGQAGAVPAAYLEKFVPTVEELLNEIPLAQPELNEPTPSVYQQELNEPPPSHAWVSSEPHAEPQTTSVEDPNLFDPYISVVDAPPSAPLTDDYPTMPLSQPTLSDPFYQSDLFPNTNPFGHPPDPFSSNTNGYEDAYTIPASYPQPPVIDSPYDPSTSIYDDSSAGFRNFELPPLTPTPEPTPAPAPAPALVSTSTENLATPPSPQAPLKEKKSSGFFGTLRRQKTDDQKNRRKTTGVNPEAVVAATASTTTTTQNHSDSDGFSDSGSHTIASPTLKANAENKPATAAKARFFDKHGLDTYILSGSKLKFEDHAEIGYNEGQGGVYWVTSATLPPFTCRVEEPHKGTKLGGLKAFMEYGIHTTFSGNRVVNRRYKHFDWLYEQLMLKYRFICIPQLPGKQIAGRFEEEFVEERRRQLELWLNRICQHPVLCTSFPVQHFVKCELTDKNNKEWKSGKRKVEKEESRDALWLHSVNLIQSHPNELQTATSIEAFAQQQPALETHLKNLSQGLSKFVERHTEIYEKDMQKIGELFAKLHTAVEVDASTAGNQELANSIAKISGSYNAIAQLYKTKASDGIRYFNEHLQEHIGILSCFPAILQIHRSANEFIRTVQQRGPAATPDYNGAIQRNQILNHVVLAEINLFQRDKVRDLHSYMKTVLSEQIQFYEKVTDELRDALSTFH